MKKRGVKHHHLSSIIIVILLVALLLWFVVFYEFDTVDNAIGEFRIGSINEIEETSVISEGQTQIIKSPGDQGRQPMTQRTFVEDGYTLYVYGVDLVAKSNDEGITYYHQDYLSSNRFSTDVDGELTSKNVQYPYGSDFSDAGTKEADTSYKFTGQEQDDDLYYYGARYYDPNTARFISIDPIFRPATSPYAYAANNPIKFVDPTGKNWEINHNRVRNPEDYPSDRPYASTATEQDIRNLQYFRYGLAGSMTVLMAPVAYYGATGASLYAGARIATASGILAQGANRLRDWYARVPARHAEHARVINQVTGLSGHDDSKRRIAFRAWDNFVFGVVNRLPQSVQRSLAKIGFPRNVYQAIHSNGEAHHISNTVMKARDTYTVVQRTRIAYEQVMDVIHTLHVRGGLPWDKAQQAYLGSQEFSRAVQFTQNEKFVRGLVDVAPKVLEAAMKSE
ncbi:RHS repeat-associated core domain-containing protein [Candidatus Aenigmatarchaeota archaeon]